MTDPIKGLFDSTFAGLERSLDLTWQRNQAIASNIANAETPQYRAADLTFADELERAFDPGKSELAATHPKHLGVGEATRSHLVPDYSGVTRPDGNNVDIDLQMGRLTANGSDYTKSAQLIRKEFSDLREIIRRFV